MIFARPTLWDLLRFAWDEVSGARHRREIRALVARNNELLRRGP